MSSHAQEFLSLSAFCYNIAHQKLFHHFLIKLFKADQRSHHSSDDTCIGICVSSHRDHFLQDKMVILHLRGTSKEIVIGEDESVLNIPHLRNSIVFSTLCVSPVVEVRFIVRNVWLVGVLDQFLRLFKPAEAAFWTITWRVSFGTCNRLLRQAECQIKGVLGPGFFVWIVQKMTYWYTV